MQRSHLVVLSLFSCLSAAPLLAQTATTIGGGTCTSGSLNGIYAITISGRSVTGAATPGQLTNVFEALGSATFDGLSKVTFTLTQNNTQASGTTLNWSGNYSVQTNCVGAITITSGGNATFNVVLYAQGADFLMTGNDSTYAYSGSANDQPTGCSTALLAGVYTISAQGYYGLAKGTAGGAGNITGLLQFDGQGNVTVNITLSANGFKSGQTQSTTGISYTGTYSMSSSCLGSATVSNSSSGTVMLSFSVYTATKTYSSNLYVVFASNPVGQLFSGAANAIYGQPTATSELAPVATPASIQPVRERKKKFSEIANRGERA
jgi:hypothetical protein